MAEPSAIFLTWTTYGSWLPGDQRGWMDRHYKSAIKKSSPQLEASARSMMRESAFILTEDQCKVVRKSIQKTCSLRNWKMYALSVYSNHVHVLISCSDKNGSQTLNMLKAHCARALKEYTNQTNRKHWWTRSGSVRCLYKKESLKAVIEYIENQSNNKPPPPGWG